MQIKVVAMKWLAKCVRKSNKKKPKSKKNIILQNKVVRSEFVSSYF